MATTAVSSLRCMAGMTFAVPILAEPRTPHLIFMKKLSTQIPSFPGRSDLDQYGPVSWHNGRELIPGGREILVHPQISHGLRAGQTEIGELCRNRCRLGSSVEEADGHRAIRQRACPDVG